MAYFVTTFYFIATHVLVNALSIESIKSTTSNSTVFYVFQGDTQFWWACDPTNSGCLQDASVSWCNKYLPDSKTCEFYGGLYSNRAQFKSIATLAKRIAEFHAGGIEGLVINGDLTAYGHTDELYYFRQYWRKYSSVDYWSGFKVSYETDKWFADNVREIYLGLGNHDYANNVDDCFQNNCAINMLDYMLKAAPPNSTMDVQGPVQISHKYQSVVYQAQDYAGSLAYSWKTCSARDVRKCLLFFQLHNYPTYRRFINTWNEQYNITDSLSFLKSQLELRHNDGTGVVVNFHDFDEHFTDEGRARFVTALTGPYNVVAIFVAHYHSMVGLNQYLCVNNRNVPVIYAGSVPANNYVLAQFDVDNLDVTKQTPNYYKIHVQDIDGDNVMELLKDIRYDSC